MQTDFFSELIITKVQAVNHINYKTHETCLRRNRAMFALACKIQGRTIYASEDTSYLSDCNHIVFLPKGASYSVTYEAFGECFMIEFDATASFVLSDIQSIAISNPLEIQAIFRRLERLWSSKKTAHRNKCMSGLYEILARMEESNSIPYQLSRKYTLIQPAVEYLETNYANSELNVDMLACRTGISAVYFRKIFSGIYQIPPAKYLQNIRLEKAKELLISDYSSISEVAAAVGFGSIYHFCKIFKKNAGCTPTEFAKGAHFEKNSQ